MIMRSSWYHIQYIHVPISNNLSEKQLHIVGILYNYQHVVLIRSYHDLMLFRSVESSMNIRMTHIDVIAVIFNSTTKKAKTGKLQVETGKEITKQMIQGIWNRTDNPYYIIYNIRICCLLFIILCPRLPTSTQDPK